MDSYQPKREIEKVVGKTAIVVTYAGRPVLVCKRREAAEEFRTTFLSTIRRLIGPSAIRDEEILIHTDVPVKS